MPFYMAPEDLPDQIHSLVRSSRIVPPRAKPSTYLARSNRIRFHCSARNSHLPKTNRNPLAAKQYGFDFRYRPGPSWATYSSLLEFAQEIGDEIHELRPRDLIDIQSFIWVLGSDEYK